MRRILTLLLLLSTGLLTPLWAGCGIDFGSADEHTEPMAHLRVTGTRRAGEELQVELAYSQTLPVAGSLSFPLRVDRAGEYSVVCVTLADEENKLSQVISIGPAG